jgi:hypothetical protein
MAKTAVLVEADTTTAMLELAEQVWGIDLLAYLLGAGVDEPLADWRVESAIDEPGTAARLRTVVAVQRCFEDAGTARAWARNIHPGLGFQSPATIIRTGTDAELLAVQELADRESQKLNRH